MPFVRRRCQGPNRDPAKYDEPCDGLLGDMDAELEPAGLSVTLPPVPDADRRRCPKCGLWTRFERKQGTQTSDDAKREEDAAA